MDFCKEKMKRFLKQDALLRKVYKDLTKRELEEEEALLVIFNSYVLEDAIMEDIYENL